MVRLNAVMVPFVSIIVTNENGPVRGMDTLGGACTLASIRGDPRYTGYKTRVKSNLLLGGNFSSNILKYQLVGSG